MRKPVSLKLCYIADARSPIFSNWVKHLVDAGHEVHVISTYPCAPDSVPGATITLVPIAFSGLSRIRHDGTIGAAKHRSALTPLLAKMRSGSAANVVKAVRYWFGPRELQWHMRKVRRVIAAFSPDVVHAMRIPFEGMLASQAIPTEFPLLVSVWGNDFTLHATRRPLMKRLTRDTLRRADALHCDCERDLRLAHELGFDHDKPTLVLPGAGGVQQNLFAPGGADVQLRRRLNIPHGAPVIINPRGFRAYVRNDKFFDAMPRVLKTLPDAVFICNGMAGNSVAENWVESHGIAGNVRLLPTLPRNDMAGLFRIADISVSPSTHDGTPNSMLEAMSCGCFPVAGDIESVREWITDGVNGLLCDATNADSQATAMIRALDDVSLRERAKKINLKLISERAEYNAVMQRAEAFYYDVIESHKAGKLLT